MRNARVRTKARSSVRSARQAIGAGGGTSQVAVAEAIRELDQAASRGVIHRKNAARRKSRLQRQLAKSKTGR
jgi:small subunit ribosomal protein S20